MKIQWKLLFRRIALLAICLGILMFVTEIWIMISPSSGVLRKTKEAQCRATMAGFILGLDAYHTEFGRFPSEAVSTTPSQTRGKILMTLHVEGTGQERAGESNPRGINFYDPPVAKQKKTGVYYDEHKEPVLVDPWGTPFYFMASPDGKNEVSNPDPKDRQQNPKIQTSKSIIMYSAGPDRDPDTWEDNILSWK